MIELSLELPLARFPLRLEARLPAGVTAVMGPSGSGKTSLLEAMAGLRPRARGRIVVEGQTVLDSVGGLRLPPERRRMGYVPQDAGLFPHLSVLDNVRFGARRSPERAHSALQVLGLATLSDRYPASLSAGERQRVALARALATGPRLLLLDEPLAALDMALRERVLPYLLRVRDEWRMPMLYVTHNAGEALALADHVLLLREGSLQAQGPPETMLGTLAAEAGAAEAELENLLRGRVLDHDREGGVTRVQLDGGPVVAALLEAGRPPGSAASLAIRAEDILVATSKAGGLSARNLYGARIVHLERTGVDVTLRCALEGGSAQWWVRLTPAAVAELGLTAQAPLWLAVKSHSVRWL